MKQVIDISQHNGIVDFVKIRESGIKDVIIRLGWIGNHNNHTIDKNFTKNFYQAKMYGFNIGIYVMNYCVNTNTIKDGIKWTIELLKNKSIELPVFIDIEDDPESNSYMSKIDKNILTDMCIIWCKEIESKGYKAGIYANKNFFTNYLDHSRLVDYKIWWAEYNGKDKPTNKYKVDLWQYTSKGKVNGIKGNVDISYCMCECKEEIKPINNGDDVEVKTYVNGSTVEPVYSDTNLTNKIGFLNPREQCECLGIYQNRAIVRYKVDKINNYKIGFVSWLGGVK